MLEFTRLVLLTGGLLAIMPILLVVTLAVAIERLYILKKILRQGRYAHNNLRQVAKQDADGLQAIVEASGDALQSHLISTAIALRGESVDEMELQLDEEIMAATPKITRRLWVLDTSVTIAPLLGLFGTIIGMIQAFNVLSSNGGPSKVTGGIADALVSTGAGLLIAIIAVYFVNYFSTLAREIMHQLELIKIVLINRMQGGSEGEAEAVRPVRLSAGA
jgi:biopolymer transport protein ExbB